MSIARAFDAPRARARPGPPLAARPAGLGMPVCEMDLRPGGRFRWRWRSNTDDGGQEFGFHGEFVEVDRPALIRHTEDYDPGDVGGDMGGVTAMVTVRFTERDGRTTVTTLVDYGSEEARDAALATGMTDGMEMSYPNLDALLAETAEA